MRAGGFILSVSPLSCYSWLIMADARPIHTIALFPKLQADTAAAVYILKAFGETAFPGIRNAQMVFWSASKEGKTPAQWEQEGYLLIDLGGQFDHHHANQESGRRTECVATLVAKHLGVENHPALKKLLAWAKRDDLEGKGTISPDALDRAFGLSGIIMSLNREYAANPTRTLNILLEIIHAHVREEFRRQVEFPQEWQTLQKTGKGKLLNLKQGNAELRAAILESDNTSLPGFLRAAEDVDLIVQRRSSGHTNIITKQLRSIDLKPVVAAIRRAEAQATSVGLNLEQAEWEKPGRVEALPMWFYDDAANTLQNGGVSPQDIPPTRLSLDQIVTILNTEIPKGVIGSLKRKKEQGQ